MNAFRALNTGTTEVHMFSNIIPATAFAVATSAPATLPVLDVLAFAGRHPMAVCATAVALVVLLIGRSFRKDARQHKAITAAYARWSLTGEPQPGWGPSWAWSGFRADPEDDEAEDQAAEDEVPAAVCASCHLQPATVTVSVAGGPTFHLCSGCSPVATVVGRAS